MAELEYALLADFATLAADGALTVVGGHRGTFHVARTPTEQLVCVAGRLLVGRREPPAVLSLGALTPAGEVPVVAQWPVEPDRSGHGQVGDDGRLGVCFAVTLMAPVPVLGAYELALSVNGEPARRLAFAVARADGAAP